MLRFRSHRPNLKDKVKVFSSLKRLLHGLWLTILSLMFVFNLGPVGINAATTALPYPIMHFTSDELEQQNQLALSAPIAAAHAQVSRELDAQLYGNALSLLSRLSYVPKERDQGDNGSCWVWTSTGIMEIALNVQRGITNRLSIQYVMSNYNGGSGTDWAGNGGNATVFANFYNSKKLIIPWSNLNANYQDYHSINGTIVPASSISTDPNFGLTSVATSRIQTFGVSTASAISNIKAILNQNKGVYFGFYLANTNDWKQFTTWWSTQPETSIWNYGFSDNKLIDPVTGGGHGVLCVGYDDSDADPAKHYWIMLNSWGNTSGRPGDLFRIPMEYNYSSADSSGIYHTSWWTITPVYTVMIDKAGTTPSIPSSSINPKSSVPAYW